MNHDILVSIHKNFVLHLNAFEFNFELLIHLELMLWEATCIFIIWLMLGVIFINYYFQNLELRWFFPNFRNPSWSQTAQPKNPKIAFREEFSFQIYNSFSTIPSKMGCSWFLVSTQKLAWFLKAWKISFEEWSKERSLCIEPGC